MKAPTPAISLVLLAAVTSLTHCSGGDDTSPPPPPCVENLDVDCTVVRFDPKTEKFQSWAIPSGVGIIRHMRKTPDGNLTIHQTSTNRIGLAIIGKPGRG